MIRYAIFILIQMAIFITPFSLLSLFFITYLFRLMIKAFTLVLAYFIGFLKLFWVMFFRLLFFWTFLTETVNMPLLVLILFGCDLCAVEKLMLVFTIVFYNFPLFQYLLWAFLPLFTLLWCGAGFYCLQMHEEANVIIGLCWMDLRVFKNWIVGGLRVTFWFFWRDVDWTQRRTYHQAFFRFCVFFRFFRRVGWS